MGNKQKNAFQTIKFLGDPLLITDQHWPQNVDPLVSISCITYNHESFIRDAIEGFLMQKTTFPVEILIHDDASTDRTAEIVKEYEARFPQLFRCFYQPENTFSKPDKRALRKPFREARRGIYIALCEGDDYWTDPLKLQKQVTFLEANEGYNLCCGGFIALDFMSNKASSIIKAQENKYAEGYSFELKDTIGNWITKSLTLIYRSSAIDINDLPPYQHFRDVHLNYHLLKEGKGYYFNCIFGVYRKHQGGIFGGINEEENLRKSLKIYKELYEFNRDEYTRISYLNAILSVLAYKNRNKKQSAFSFKDKFKLCVLSFKISRKIREYFRITKKLSGL